MDNGHDKTDRKEDARIAREALAAQNRMPFYASEPDVVYAPVPRSVK